MNTNNEADAVIHTTDANFQQDVLDNPLPVLVDFWAPWCGPCKAIAPVLEEIAAEHSEIRVVKLNVDDNQEAATKYNVRAIPTLLLFQGGEVVATKIGAVRKPELEEMLTVS